MSKRRSRLSLEAFAAGITQGDRVILGRAITLVESNLNADKQLSSNLINQLLPETGKALRIGITGVPGVGKSSFIETFGSYLCEKGNKVAVLAIDPSSQRTGGSILGDKTRMEQLAHHPNAFIRPSPTGNSLGGVATKTRETMLLCEAAGYEIILVETVGVGQSEVAVKDMTDFFLLLMLAGAGDELQGIKKGIMEMADGIAITKADGDNIKASKRARAEYQNALHLFPPDLSGWSPEVLICSAKDHTGIEDIWKLITTYEAQMKESGYFQHQRNEQNHRWMHEIIKHELIDQFFTSQKVQDALSGIENKLMSNQITPRAAAESLMDIHRNDSTD